VSFHYNYRWLLLAIVEVLLVAWIASAGKTSWSGTSWYALLEHWLLRPPPVAGLIMFAIAFAAAAARSWMESDATELRPMAVGLGFALVAFMLACEFAKSGAAFGVYMSAGGVILLVTLLQESHRMAFNDTLTGLPGRRALEERLPGLGPLYTIAMIDVDHFKRFNDTHGHEIGDQVLKLVAARLGGVEGGGTAYRYGGEEFSVLFPNKRLDEALPHLEAMRAAIEAYRMAMRSADRPKDPETGSQLRRRERPENTLSVTVSIGAAQRDAVLTEPAMVLRAADKALYRAKQSGRNMVCS
jgi:diguanylate cyclase (GGDEF)-like protein